MLNHRKLTDRFCRTVENHTGKPELHCDGGGLNLRVMPSGSKQWVQRIHIDGRARMIGLGGYPVITLAKAREKALTSRRLVAEGKDPIAIKRRPKLPTFARALDSYIELQRAAWRSGSKTERLWRSTMRDYVLPRIGGAPVDKVTVRDVLAILEPLRDKPETLKKVRQRIRGTMDWAIANGHRRDANPAGEAINAAMPARGKATHHKALPYREVPAAVAKVRECDAPMMARLALEFVILTAVRSGEARAAELTEIDLDERLWKIPGKRMKTGEPHTVPLSDRCMAIIAEAMAHHDGSGLLFPSTRGRPTDGKVVSSILHDLNINGTVHGFRSSFRDWCAERANVDRQTAEAALAHAVPGVEGAYLRADLLDKRRRLMDTWAQHVDSGTGKVLHMAG